LDAHNMRLVAQCPFDRAGAFGAMDVVKLEHAVLFRMGDRVIHHLYSVILFCMQDGEQDSGERMLALEQRDHASSWIRPGCPADLIAELAPYSYLAICRRRAQRR